MDNIYFKKLFNKFSGFVYQYNDEIPDGEDPSNFLINEFVDLTKKSGLEINLVRTSNGNYVLHSYENLNSEVFIKLCDLNEDLTSYIVPPVETVPEEEE